MNQSILKSYIFIVIAFLTSSTALGQTNEIVRDSSFVIAEDVKDFYEGTYKDGAPFDGYFKTGERDFYQVNYYKKGVLKYQYSKDFLALMLHVESEQGYEQKPTMDLKTTYKNQKVWTGREYLTVKDAITTKIWNKGILSGLLLDVFAAHYYNRLTFDIKSDTLFISDFKEKDGLTAVYFEGDNTVTDFFNNSKLVSQRKLVDVASKQFPANSQMMCTYLNDEISCTVIQLYDTTIQMPTFYQSLNYFIDGLKKDKVEDIVQALADGLSSEEKMKTVFQRNPELQYAGMAETDKSGAISEGILWFKSPDNGHYKIYENGTVTAEEAVDIVGFQDVANTYFEKKQ